MVRSRDIHFGGLKLESKLEKFSEFQGLKHGDLPTSRSINGPGEKQTKKLATGSVDHRNQVKKCVQIKTIISESLDIIFLEGRDCRYQHLLSLFEYFLICLCCLCKITMRRLREIENRKS